MGRLISSEGRAWQGTAIQLFPQTDTLATRITWTYLSDTLQMAQPDVEFAENFVFSNIPAGKYIAYAKVKGIEYRQSVTITAGKMTKIEIVTKK